MNRKYLCIDLKSFFASVECVELGLDPLKTNLVVADISRTEKTICLAVTPSLKSFGISGRARLYEVVQKVNEINYKRLKLYGKNQFLGESSNIDELNLNPSLKLSYIVSSPKMAKYIHYSTKIYNVYLKYVAPKDMHIYSIDEVFIDVTSYLNAYKMSAENLAKIIVTDVFNTTGITATVGVGTNMYLAKIAMDVMAKKMKPDKNGARIASLDELSYRHCLWDHKPLTDFWRVGKSTQKKLHDMNMFTMGDIARASIDNYWENKLYKTFGVNAELMIDHAWGYESCTFDDLKSYVPENKSVSEGQVLTCGYDYEKTKLIVREMLELLSLRLVREKIVTNQIVMTIGYDIENLTDSKIISKYNGEITTDFYGRFVPKQAHSSINLPDFTSSTRVISQKGIELFDKIVNPDLLVRRINLCANHIKSENDIKDETKYDQLSFFTDYEKVVKKRNEEKKLLEKERKIQKTTLELKERFGKNAILKGFNLKEGATTIKRNKQIGGHSAGDEEKNG